MTIENGSISGVARRQNEGGFTSINFTMGYELAGGSGPITWVSDYPHEDFSLVDEGSGEELISGSAYVLLTHLGVDPSWRTHEVLYVGQAFGKSGERQAFDRLRKHDTLQRIYSEQRPDREIWLSLCAITDVAVMSTMHPTDNGTVSAKENTDHVVRAHRRVVENRHFNGREGVAIAEAGLIRYFQPKYNKVFKNNFPDPDHVSLAECMDLEINTVILELHGMNVQTRYMSSGVEANYLHFPQYPLFEADGRDSLLDFMGSLGEGKASD
ncbi:hypothetical protein [Streptomyces sp. BH104]|uniref:hypothetical protein n=1 Tax=Streptomyces sp. BH104 TaxID=3410407 RepID=UPI003BB731BD